jgi:hypothetical protein
MDEEDGEDTVLMNACTTRRKIRTNECVCSVTGARTGSKCCEKRVCTIRGVLESFRAVGMLERGADVVVEEKDMLEDEEEPADGRKSEQLMLMSNATPIERSSSSSSSPSPFFCPSLYESCSSSSSSSSPLSAGMRVGTEPAAGVVPGEEGLGSQRCA